MVSSSRRPLARAQTSPRSLLSSTCRSIPPLLRRSSRPLQTISCPLMRRTPTGGGSARLHTLSPQRRPQTVHGRRRQQLRGAPRLRSDGATHRRVARQVNLTAPAETSQHHPACRCAARPGTHSRLFGLPPPAGRSEEHTSELQSRVDLVCRLLLEKKKRKIIYYYLVQKKTNIKYH